MITIFTDGASRGNPGPGGWGAIIVFPKGKNKNNFQFSNPLSFKEGGKTIGNFQVKEIGGREKLTTNNQMELTAAIKALENIPFWTSDVQVFTDSSYLINGMTKWVHGWQKNNWKTKDKKDVLNKKLWEKLIKSVNGKKIHWKYLGGHSGIAGNERCDEIATLFADSIRDAVHSERSLSTELKASRRTQIPKLYSGPIDKYEIDILNTAVNEKKSSTRSKSKPRSKLKAYSYLSLVDGKIVKHSNWLDCEKRVKGKSGAKFKKSLSSVDEKQIIKEWGKP